MKAIVATKGFMAMKEGLPPALVNDFRRLDVKGDAEEGVFVVRARKGRYAAVVNWAREPRRELIRGLLADALLRSSTAATRLKAKPLAVVGAPRLTESTAAELAQYVAEVAPGREWLGFDESGVVFSAAPALELTVSARPRTPSAERAAPLADPFSDLNQWLLKVLLAPSFPEKLLRAPRGEYRNASVLAEAADVSLPSVVRLLQRLRADGFVDDSGPSLRLVRVEELFERWRSAVQRRPAPLPVRFLNPVTEARRHVGLLSAVSRAMGGKGGRIALGYFLAAEALQFPFVSGAPLDLYAEDAAPASLHRLGLVHCEPGQPAELFVHVPKHPEAVFRAAVDAAGRPATDVIQTWLDVSAHPARGRELSERLWRKAILPALGSER